MVRRGVRPRGRPAQQVGEPNLHIDIVELGGDDKQIHRGSPLAAAIGTGDERTATIYSLIETAKLNGLDPGAYLCDVLARITGSSD
jgi:hypothetical protein